MAPFGTQGLAGGQAEYVRVPLADGTLQAAPADVDDELLIMMSDIFPTGYYGAMRAIECFKSEPATPATTNGEYRQTIMIGIVQKTNGKRPHKWHFFE